MPGKVTLEQVRKWKVMAENARKGRFVIPFHEESHTAVPAMAKMIERLMEALKPLIAAGGFVSERETAGALLAELDRKGNDDAQQVPSAN